jgi:hypothetical protein
MTEVIRVAIFRNYIQGGDGIEQSATTGRLLQGLLGSVLVMAGAWISRAPLLTPACS